MIENIEIGKGYVQAIAWLNPKFTTAVPAGFQSLGLGVVCRFLSALKTGTEPKPLNLAALLLGCKAG
jgi:hypothetical protein